MDLGKDSKPGLLFGEFRVEKLNEPDKDPENRVPYLLHGKRASYSLWRNQKDPRCLFVMGEPVCKPKKCRGFEWFYEAPCGRLIPYS